jgi:glycosyltransferase involved in cell wall biosynthesis
MRIGFLHYGDLSTRTGGFLYDRMLIHGLEQCGDEVEIYQLPWRSYPTSLISSMVGHELKHFSPRDFDLLIEDELAHPSLITFNRRVGERAGTPLISLVHHLRSSEDHPEPLSRLYKWVEKRYLGTLDGVIANSTATMETVQSMLDQSLPSLIAPPGRGHFKVDITEHKIGRRSLRDGPLEILFLGSVIPRKRLGDLVEALARLRHLDIRLTVIGREASGNSYVRRIKQRIKSSGLKRNVTWLGEQPDAQVSDTLEKSHLLVVPSTHEGFGIAYLDAMAYGVVPIGTSCGGATSIIEHADNGFLVEPGNIPKLMEYIALLATDRQRLNTMAVNALHRHKQQPSWKEVTGSVHHYLQAHFTSKSEQQQFALV